MELNLKGKRALVCGGSEGIGLAAAIELSQLGAHITLLSRNKTKLDEALKQLANTNQQHHMIVGDLSHLDELKSTMENYLSSERIHILVNNAGGPPPGELLGEDPSKFTLYFSQLVLSAQVLTALVIPGMVQDNYGRIINVISTSVKSPIPGLGVSNTIRGAMASWSKTLSRELGPKGITVNNLLPGTTKTGRITSLIQNRSNKTGESYADVEAEMLREIPLGRFAEAKEQGEAIAFLASPAASYITGTNLIVDGGRTNAL